MNEKDLIRNALRIVKTKTLYGANQADLIPGPRTYRFEIKTENDKLPGLLNCGKDCGYLEYQSASEGVKGSPYCTLFQKKLVDSKTSDLPVRSKECISAVEGLT